MAYGIITLGTFSSLLIGLWLTNNSLQNMTDATSKTTNAPVKPYVLKCCPWNYTIQENGSCIQREGPVAFLVPKQEKVNGTVGEYDSNHFNISIGEPKLNNETCNGHINVVFSRNSNEADEFGINEDGYLLQKTEVVISQPGQFCLEKVEDSGFTVLICENENDESVENDVTANPNEKYILILVIVSLLFMVCTFFVYALIKELRNVHGKSIMSHVASLSMAFLGLIITSITGGYIQLKTPSCFIIGYMVQFFFLAAFFWLNIMCFDLWRAFSGFRSFEEIDNQQTSKKFIIYSFYSWGSPTLITLITYCMQFKLLSIPFLPNPGICEINHWFVDKKSSFFYFYGPIGIIFFCNILMFVHTAVIIFRQMKDRLNCENAESKINSKQDIWRFVLYLKLFIVMGISWIPEVLSIYVKNESQHYVLDWLWYILDDINASQGVLIFFVVVCKKRVIIMVKEKLGLEFTIFKITSVTSTRTQNDI